MTPPIDARNTKSGVGTLLAGLSLNLLKTAVSQYMPVFFTFLND